MANTNFQVTLTMSPSTVTALANSQYYLYGFLAVQSSDAAVVPLVWLQTQQYSVNSQVSWSNQYQAYTSTSAIAPSDPIIIAFSAPIALGQLLTVQQSTGIGVVTNEGTSGVIEILNGTNTLFTCGISEPQGNTFAPVCAMPLYGGGLQLIAPLPKILLLFSTVPVKPGTVIGVSYGPGILIDLSSADQRTVCFDINNGWSWGGYSWAQSVPANSSLVPLLTERSEALASLAVRMIAESNHARVSSLENVGSDSNVTLNRPGFSGDLVV